MMNKPDLIIEKELVRESIFIIGKVLSINGRTVIVKVNKNKNHSHALYMGKTVKNVSVGSYIKIVKGFITLIGKVEGEFTQEERYFNKEYKKEETRINRTLQVSLFGHFEEGNFRQGIKEMPLIDNECYILDRQEFSNLHKFHDDLESTIELGTLTEEPSQKINLSVNKLFASHMGIFGNTGSGKSNTLARMYNELFENNKSPKFKSNAKFVIIDFNGEYVHPEVITSSKIIHNLSTEKPTTAANKYPISSKDLNKTEILAILLEATEKTQKPFLDRVLRSKFYETGNFNTKVLTSIGTIVETVIQKKDPNNRESVIFELLRSLFELVTSDESTYTNFLENIEKRLHFHTGNDYYWITDNQTGSEKVYNDKVAIYKTHLDSQIKGFVFKSDMFSKLKIKIILAYYHEMISGYSNHDFTAPLIGRMSRKFSMLENLITEEKPGQAKSNITVVSLRDVESTEMKKVIPLIVCKKLYEEQKTKNPITHSLHLIIDEAHNILSSSSQRESESWKDYRLETFEEIIKEGRKFSAFLTISSQRPFDISATIISQLHNYFIHKLVNDNDIQAISKTVAYLDRLSFETIPILPVGSCFVAGLASDLPIKVNVNLLSDVKQPHSKTINLSKSWK